MNLREFLNPILSLLDASLTVFVRVVRANLAKLAAVFLPLNLLAAYVHGQVVNRFAYGADVPTSAFASASAVGRIYNLVIGLLAVILTIRAAWTATEQPTDQNEVHDSLGDAWRLTFGTNLLVSITFFAVIAATAVAFLMFRTLPIIGFIVGGCGLGLGIILLLRLSVAVHMSALFRLGPIEALRASFGITRNSAGTILVIWILSSLIAAALSAVPWLLFACDTIGPLHPFATDNTTVRTIVGILYALLGIVLDIIRLFPVVALTLFLRSRIEAPVGSPQAKPRRAFSLALVGIVFFLLIAAILPFRNCDHRAHRVFRMENMDRKQTDVASQYCCTHVELVGGNETLGRTYMEKPTLFDFSDKRLLWYEVPFCSKCGKGIRPLSKVCPQHELDTFAFKPVWIDDVHEYRPKSMAPSIRELLPDDIQRAMTDEEKARVNELQRTFDPHKALDKAAIHVYR